MAGTRNQPPPPAATSQDRAAAGPRSDRGVVAVEFVGWLPLLFLIALAALQLGFVGYAAQQAGSAARAAARTAAQAEISDQYAVSGRASLSGWLADGARFDLAACGDEATVTAHVTVPSVLPFLPGLDASKSVTMPCD